MPLCSIGSRPATRASIGVWILNYNGRGLLGECLPSVLRAAHESLHPVRVVVVDNQSTDDSIAWLAAAYPEVEVIRQPNRGLCSYNDVLAQTNEPVAVLLNNDVKLASGAIDPLVRPLVPGTPEHDPDGFMTAPLCWKFDGRTYEGSRTAVRWRWGLIQVTALFPGHESRCFEPGLMAGAGAVFAVDRVRFVELGGFDKLYLPGRIEDVDLAFRAFQAGYNLHYVPDSVAYHRGLASYRAAFGDASSHRLALRNTLLLQWKHLRDPLHVARHLLSLPLRLVFDIARIPWQPRGWRLLFCRALLAAIIRSAQIGRRAPGLRSLARERQFFRQFDYRRMAAGTIPSVDRDRWPRAPTSTVLAATPGGNCLPT